MEMSASSSSALWGGELGPVAGDLGAVVDLPQVPYSGVIEGDPVGPFFGHRDIGVGTHQGVAAGSGQDERVSLFYELGGHLARRVQTAQAERGDRHPVHRFMPDGGQHALARGHFGHSSLRESRATRDRLSGSRLPSVRLV